MFSIASIPTKPPRRLHCFLYGRQAWHCYLAFSFGWETNGALLDISTRSLIGTWQDIPEWAGCGEYANEQNVSGLGWAYGG
jgi:hypothetical protein